MVSFKRAAKTCGVWIAGWKGDYRVWVVLLFELSVLARELVPTCRFALANGEGVPVFSLPLLMGDFQAATGLPKISIFLGAAALFSDIPFFSEKKLYQLIRADKKEWFLAHIFYIFAVSFFYLLFITVMSFLLWMPAVRLQDGWGSLITHTVDGKYQALYSLSGLQLPKRIFFRVPYWDAFLYTAAMTWTVCVIIGLVTFVLNLYMGFSGVGTVAGLFLVFIDPVLIYFLNAYNGWMFYASPVNWASIACIKEYKVYLYSVLTHRGIAAAALCWSVCLTVPAVIKWKRKEFLLKGDL